MKTNICNIEKYPGFNIFKESVFVKENTYDISEDPIVLSCTIKRLKQMHKDDPTNHELNTLRKPVQVLIIGEDQKIITPFITDEDRILASDIKKFYEQKIIVLKLRGEKLSDFRERLCALFSNTSNQYTDTQCKIAYKLPYFYEYDLGLIDIFGTGYSIVGDRSEEYDIKTLTYIKKLDAVKKSKPRFEYWFCDENENKVVLEVEKSNPLIPLWETHILSAPISVGAKFIKSYKDNLHYYSPKHKWEMK
jgi:hypothetical protein